MKINSYIYDKRFFLSFTKWIGTQNKNLQHYTVKRKQKYKVKSSKTSVVRKKMYFTTKDKCKWEKKHCTTFFKIKRLFIYLLFKPYSRKWHFVMSFLLLCFYMWVLNIVFFNYHSLYIYVLIHWYLILFCFWSFLDFKGDLFFALFV